MLQTKQAICRNVPLVGHVQDLLQLMRPEINHDFVESNSDGEPFSRNDRSVICRRATCEVDTLPFGAPRDVQATGYRGINRSLAPTGIDFTEGRMDFGGPDCTQRYSTSILKVSAMSKAR